MKRGITTLALGFLFSLCIISCGDDVENAPDAGDQIEAKFTAGISTRATDVLWDVNDAIGVTMTDRKNGGILNDVYNRRYFTTDMAGSFIPGSQNEIVYFPQNGDEVLFKSYYPYSAAVTQDQVMPVSVANQTELPKIDFMSAEHLSGFTKNDPNVSLRFHHRLSKVIFRLSVADNVQGLFTEDINLTIKGMKTTGTYNLLQEALTVDNNSVKDITIPARGTKNERTGIVLPRVASPGVVFDFTSAGGSSFSAAMPDTLNLRSGYKYFFDIRLEASSVSVSVTIQDWIEGPTTTYDILSINVPAGASYGAIAGDKINLFMKNGNVYDALRTFTYSSEGKWTTDSPIYWDDIQVSPLQLRASLVPRKEAKNDTQLPDILVADELSVARNTGANLVFRHAGSRVKVTLQSNLYTSAELAAAAITLPSYLTGGKEEKGVFIPGTIRKNVIVDRSDANDPFAIIQPQPVSPGAELVKVTIKGKEYTAKSATDGFLYEAGVAYELIVRINENSLSVSARVIDWVPDGPYEFDVLEVTPVLNDTEGVDAGARMAVYRKDNATYQKWTTFTYSGTNKWTADNEVFWKDVATPSVDLRASIIAKTKLNNSQLDDILIAGDLNVPVGSGANFVFHHVASRAVVKLISDTFSQDDLDGATIVMPGYAAGGIENLGSFVPGNLSQNITLHKDVNTRTRAVSSTDSQIALIQPQKIAANANLFRVTIGSRDYWAKAPAEGFTYKAGVSYGITIHVNENNLSVSVQVIPWTTDNLELNAVKIGTSLPGSSSNVKNGEKMDVYISDGATRKKLSTFTYSATGDSWTASPVVFWESITGNPAFFGSILRAAKLNNTQLDDYLVSGSTTAVEGNPLNFELKHAAAKVVVQLKSSDLTFSDAELKNMTMVLPDYVIGGSINNGEFEFDPANPKGNVNVFIENNNATAIIRPQVISAGKILINITDPATGRTYPAISSANVSFNVNEAKTLIIDMKKTTTGMSAQVTDWTKGDDVPLVPSGIGISGSLGGTADSFKGKTIHVYKLGTQYKELTYSYLSDNGSYTWKGTEQLYWDDLNGQALNVTGVYYPAQSTIPTLSQNVTTFSWPVSNDQRGGYEKFDLLMHNQSIATPSPVNFSFKHMLSKVTVNILTQNSEFTPAELQGAVVTLKNFYVDGTASLATAKVTGGGTKDDIIPLTETDGSKYSALVIPQLILANASIVTIKLNNYSTPFTGALSTDMDFVAGKENVINITLKKTGITLSAKVEAWTNGTTGGITIE